MNELEADRSTAGRAVTANALSAGEGLTLGVTEVKETKVELPRAITHSHDEGAAAAELYLREFDAGVEQDVGAR